MTQAERLSLASRILGLPRAKLAREAGTLAASQYAGAVAGFLTTLVGARFLGPEGYGVAVLVVTLPELVLSFAAVRSSTITTKYLSSFLATGQLAEAAAVCRLGYSIDFLVSLAALGAVALAALFLSTGSIPEALEWLMVVYAGSFLASSFRGTNAAVMQTLGAFRWLGGLELAERAIVLGVASYALLAGYGVAGFVLSSAVGPVAVGVAGAIVAATLLRGQGIPSWIRAPVRPVHGIRGELAAGLGWNYLASTLGGVLIQVPILLLGWTRGPTQAGYYQLSVTMAAVASYPEVAMARVTYPVLAGRFADRGNEGSWGTLRRWTIRGGLPAAAFVLVGLFFSPVIIPAIYGPEYSIVAWTTQLLLVGVAVSAAFFWLSPYFYAAGKVRGWAQALAVYVVAVIFLGVPAALIAGTLGMALVAGVGKAAHAATMARRVQQQLRGP